MVRDRSAGAQLTDAKWSWRKSGLIELDDPASLNQIVVQQPGRAAELEVVNGYVGVVREFHPVAIKPNRGQM